jgi:hypothetical protein
VSTQAESGTDDVIASSGPSGDGPSGSWKCGLTWRASVSTELKYPIAPPIAPWVHFDRDLSPFTLSP